MLLNDELRCRVSNPQNSRVGLNWSDLSGEFGDREPVSDAKQFPDPRTRPAARASSEHPTYG